LGRRWTAPAALSAIRHRRYKEIFAPIPATKRTTELGFVSESDLSTAEHIEELCKAVEKNHECKAIYIEAST